MVLVIGSTVFCSRQSASIRLIRCMFMWVTRVLCSLHWFSLCADGVHGMRLIDRGI